jgi:transposase
MADETRLRIMKDTSGKPKTGFVSTFGSADADGGFDVAYHFAESRSGSTPKVLLEGAKGVLLVDRYSGYSDVEKVSSRRRAACFAHYPESIVIRCLSSIGLLLSDRGATGSR